MTLLAILVHEFVLISLGIWDKREAEQESILQAIRRLLELRKN